jgi:hypothetical protein
MSESTEPTILIFKTICNFVNDIKESFGKKQKSLLLYAHLLEKTGIVHEEPIRKHIRVFYDFCKKNEEAILKKDKEQIHDPVLRYSDKVFIDIAEIFELADTDEQKVLWKHLLILSAVLDPSSQAKQILREEKQRKNKLGQKGGEEDFLSNLIDQVSEHIDPHNIKSPIDAVQSIMSSGVFQDMVSSMNDGLSDGSLDLSKMMGSLQTMIGTLGQVIEDPLKTERKSEKSIVKETE